MKQKTLFHSCFVLLLSLLVQLSFTRCSSDDSPANRIPVLSINDIATGVTSSQATLEGVVTDNGSSISRCGFLVNTAKGILEKTGIDEGSVYEGSRTASGNVKVTINNLKANTTYYYCLFVVSGNTPIKSSIGNFTTAEIGEPTFSNVEVVKIGEDSITVRCRVLNDGGQPIEKLGFDYKLADSQVFTNMPVESYDAGSTDNTFTCAIGQLEPGTKYHFRATGFNGVKYGYSAIVEVETSAKTSPTVSIQPIGDENIGVNYVMVAGRIEDTGATDITERGFLIGTVSRPVIGMDGVINIPVYTATKDFSATIDNLKPTTTYYVRAYAANNPYGTKTQYGYSDPVEFTTKGWETPSFSDIVEQLEGIMLRVSCTLDNKGVNVLERGFCYSSSNTNPDLTQNVVKSESEDNKMTAAFQIQENTPYYIRPYVKYNLTGEEEVHYGTAHTSQRYTFDRPSISEIAHSDVTYSTAKLSATVADNGVTITKRGFKWGKSSTPTTVLEVSGSEFQATLDGLTPGVTYYYQAYVEFELAGKTETATSQVSSFRTTDVVKPELGDVSSKQQQNNLSLTSSVTKDNDVEVTEVGFCWSKSNSEPDLTNSSVTQGTLNESDITASITVDEYATYYIRSYAKYNLAGVTGTVYSNTQTVTIEAFDRPNFTEVKSTDITYTTALLSATLMDKGITMTKRGFKWGKSDKLANDLPISEEAFQAALEGLSPGTTYYYQAYAVYELAGKTETATSEVLTFNTVDVNKPALGDVTYKQQQTKLALTSSLTKEDDITITEFGFCYSQTTTEPDVNSSVVQGTMDEDNMTATITVEENTRYYIRSYAKYSVAGTTGTVYSSVLTMTTDGYARPSFNEVTSSDVTYNAASLNATVTTNGVNITERGFKWGTSANPTTKVQAGGNEFKASLTNLNPATKYYYRAYVVYKIDDKEETMDSEVYSFETLSSPEPSLGAVNTSQSANTLSLSCQLTDNGVEVSEVGFCWSKSETVPTVKNNSTTGTLNNGYFTASISVEENATYYLRAYAKYQALGIEQVSYSEVKSYQSESYTRPSISNVTHSDVSATSAKLSATVTSNGVDITSKGFKWGTSASNMTTQAVTTDEFVYTLTNLNANTKYYYEAYITYNVGGAEETKSSNQGSFTTQSIKAATVSVPTISNVGFHEATATSSITDNGDGTVKKKGFVWSRETSGPTLDNNHGTLELAADADFTAQITDLNDNTRYWVRAYVVTEGSGQTVTSYSGEDWYSYFYTPQMTLPSLAKPSATEITQTTITVTASLYDGGNTDVTEMGFCWSDQDIDPKDMTNKATVTADNFTATITDTQKAGNTYYIYAYATNGKGTAYSQKITATLKYIPGAGDNPHPDKE